MKKGYISSVCSGGQSCAVLADQNVMGFISALHELASKERQFYCWLCRVRKLLLTPIRSKGNWSQDIDVSNNTCLDIRYHQVCCVSVPRAAFHRECSSIFRRPVLLSLFVSLWELFPPERPDWSTLHVSHLLSAEYAGPWRHLTAPADTHGALSGRLQRVWPKVTAFIHTHTHLVLCVN